MALASQSIPTNDRRRITFSQRRLLTPKAIGTFSIAAAVLLGSWWLLTRDGSGAGDTGTDGLAGAGTNEPSMDDLSGSGRSAAPATIGAVDPQPSNRTESGGTQSGRPSLRALVAEDRAAGEADHAAGSAIEMGSRDKPVDPRATSAAREGAQTPPAAPTRPTSPTTAPANAPPQAPAGSPGLSPTTPPTAPPTAPPAAPPSSGPAVSNSDLSKALQLQASDPVMARTLVTRALDAGNLSASERLRGYDVVNALGKSLFLNTNVNPNDPVMKVHTIQPGESLAKVVRNEGLACETLLLKRINGIKDERRIQIGQRVRVPKGAFHAEVIKSEFRFNLYLDAGEGSTERVMVASLPCGLGESNGTPTGLFKVRPKSKLIDPEWTHPKTGEHFASNDPRNPIGEYWIGIMGLEDKNKDLAGYGIHGTVDPESIGHERSLGCIRMLADDIAYVYECLVDPQSTIRIK